MHKVFISYYHQDDQWYKDSLVSLARDKGLFIDGSVDTGDIDDRRLSTERIREIIRDDYLADTTVTIVLVGKNTKGRKHVDWEIYSSMFDGIINKKSGIVVVLLPECPVQTVCVGHPTEKDEVFDDIHNWVSHTDDQYDRIYSALPERLLANIKSGAKISITTWDRIIKNPYKLRIMIDNAFNDRDKCQYDFSLPMKRYNSPL